MGSLLGSREKLLFDARNVEVMRLAGACPVILWSFQKYVPSVSGSIDCIYGEPVIGSKHYIPYKILAFFERPTQISENLEGGLAQTTDSRVTISRKILELKKVPIDTFSGDRVKEGDIVQFFRDGGQFFLEARNVEKDGWVNDSSVWTQYILDCVATTTFMPDEKLLGSM